MLKAPLAQESFGSNPTDRGKNGSKRHLLVDAHGVPLSIVVTGANEHDTTQVDAVILGKLDEPRLGSKENLCADAGYVGKEISQRMMDYG